MTSDEKEISSPSIPIREIGVPALAYLGDCVFELRVREKLVRSGIAHAGDLNRAALSYVKASIQARAMEKLIPTLTEEELSYYHRGKNYSHLNTPKSATPAEYRSATGMETLFGFLYLSGNTDRINQLFHIAYP